jgi:hypothetical protein
MTTFAELRAWINSDANPPADSDGDIVQAHNGLRFCRCDDGGIWLEDEQTDGRPVTLAEAKALISR